MQTIQLHQGDSRDVLPTVTEASFDSIIADPPYEIGMSGQAWDKTGVAFEVAMWEKCYRVLKPGAFLLAFGAARTYHRLACAIEDAGFDIVDQIMWLHAQGYPKSHNLKGEHAGKGTALKPTHEPIVVARKPFKGTHAQCAQQYGTSAFNIDACRIPFENDQDKDAATWGRGTDIMGGNFIGGTHGSGKTNIEANPAGRWPANLIHDGSEAVLAEFARFGSRRSGKPSGKRSGEVANIFGAKKGGQDVTGYGDEGSIARFYFCAKATVDDRDEGLRRFALKEAGIKNASGRGFSEADPYKKTMRRNDHQTVKPTSLMRYLCRLVTPAGGLIGDPFMGSGSTGKAAVLEGYSFWGCELRENSFKLAKARIDHAVSLYKPQLTVFE